MKKALLIAALAVAAASPIAVAHADAAKVIVNGQDITADTANNPQIICGQDGGLAYVLRLSSLPAPGSYGGTVMVRLSYPDQTKVMFVNVKRGEDQLWSTQQGQPQQGIAKVTKTVNSYKVTGTIAPISNNGNNVGTPVPFEIDATCP
jgi:Mycobacterium 19 kDa lipoprotein antigen